MNCLDMSPEAVAKREAQAKERAEAQAAKEKADAERKARLDAARVTVSPSAITRAAVFMATNDIRYYLNGLLIEKAPQGGVYVVATDGAAMMIVHDAVATYECDEPQIILRASPELLRALAKSGKAKAPKGMYHRLLIAGRRVSVATDFGSEHSSDELFVQAGNPFIDGKFPHWQRVLPDFDKLKPGMLNDVRGEYLAELQKVTGSLSRYRCGLKFWQVERDAFIAVQFTDMPDTLGIIMPLRGDDDETMLKRMEPFANEKRKQIAEALAASKAKPA